MTRARQAVLDILTAAEGPLSVAAIHGLGGSRFDQVTVYRALYWLEDNGYAESFVLHCSEHGTERFFTGRSGEKAHRHWFHCETCHRFTDMGACVLESLVEGYEKQLGVSIKTHTLTFTGLCGECR
jgi:Fur family ferric uptake transcriptional regulator